MRASLMATQKGGGAPIKPWQVYSKLRLICRHLTPGRQEDAHEFLRSEKFKAIYNYVK